MRIGIGEDSHVFGEESPLILGGIEIEGCNRLKGNSDGDAVLHSLFNALSSAVGKGSISTYADPLVKRGITDSRKYLTLIREVYEAAGLTIANVSVSIEAGKPKLEEHLPKMRKAIAASLECGEDAIGLTVTSGETLSSYGKGEGIKVTSVILLQ